jgi:N4-gp56 family major capsid protein
MAQYTWTFDAPTGTYKSRALSERLYEAALQETIFMDHVKPIPAFGKRMGETVTLTRIKQLTEPTSAALSENERIPEDQLTINTTSITVKEWGRSVPFSSFSDDLSKFDIENATQNALKNQLKLYLDAAAAAAFKSAKIKYVPTSASAATITTNGTPGATAASNLNVFHLEEIRDYLYDTLFAPPANGEEYIGIFRTLALRGVMRDQAWVEWHKYTDPAAKFNGEVGRIEGIRLIETNHSAALGKVGSSSVLGEGVVFGADAVAMAEVLTPELRAKMPEDYGRSKGVAWYGIFEFGLIWDTGNAGEAKVVHVTSA